MWLYTCLQKCRRGKGGVQPRKLAAGNDFFSGSRKGTDTASNRHRSIETSKTWTRLTKRLENEHILNICKGGGAESGAGGGGAAGKTVLYCNQTKTILHPQLLQSPLSSFPPVTSSSSGTSDSRWQAECSNCLKNMQSLPCLSLQAPT